MPPYSSLEPQYTFIFVLQIVLQLYEFNGIQLDLSLQHCALYPTNSKIEDLEWKYRTGYESLLFLYAEIKVQDHIINFILLTSGFVIFAADSGQNLKLNWYPS